MKNGINSTGVDVLIIGSGPVGASYARVLANELPGIKIMMIDLGPQIAPRAGKHIKNILNDEERTNAQIRSQGPNQYPYPIATIQERAEAARAGQINSKLLARPGTHLVATNDDELIMSGMPAASLSSNVGGMGSHWTCACPRPGNTELIPFIPENEWEAMFTYAEKLLAVSQTTYDETPESNTIKSVLSDLFDHRLAQKRKVQRMPLACKKMENGQKYWTGPDVILADLLDDGSVSDFQLRAETICREILHQNGKITGALIEHLPTGKRERINSKVVVVAADAIRTPQLLWASGIRPPALGHYLNDQPQLMCVVSLDGELVKSVNATAAITYGQTTTEMAADSTLGIFWVPFQDPGHPFHGQIMHMDLSPIQVDDADKAAGTDHKIGLGWFCRKELSFDDYLEFDDSETDYSGLPKIKIHYRLTENDEREIAMAMKEQAKAAAAFGKILKEGEQFMIPAGSSLHYQGTVRMGKENDGQSVCDTFSEVWGYNNLFVGGNGVIPTSTACNPTLTSVALAVKSCERIITILKKI